MIEAIFEIIEFLTLATITLGLGFVALLLLIVWGGLLLKGIEWINDKFDELFNERLF